MSNDRLPNLVIAGVLKAGTTSLFDYLSQHPDICSSHIKELRYFLPLRHDPQAPLDPVSHYAAHFQHCEDQAYRLEASPGYTLGGKPLIDRMQQVLPGPKVLISIRNPVDRLWSGYLFSKSKGLLTGIDSFDEFVTISEWQHRTGSVGSYGQLLPAFGVGDYARYLPDWIEAFGTDLRVVFAEELFSDPLSTMRSLFAWLDLSTNLDAEELNFSTRNKSVQPRSRTVARAAYRLKAHTNRWFERWPRARAALRAAYQRTNAQPIEAVFRDETRTRLEDSYRDSNIATAALLRDNGYQHLPDWLNL